MRPDSAATRVATLGVLGALYLAQGLVAGFAGLVLIPALARAEVSLQAQGGLLALAGLPWVLKIAWGPVLDRFGAREGGRAAFIVSAAMLGSAATLWWMSQGLGAGADLSQHVARVQWQWFALSMLLSLQDVATDSLALDRIAPEQRGLANAVMLGGQHLGAEGLGGMAIGVAVIAAGAGWGLAAMAGVFAVLSVLPMLLPAPSRSVPVPTPRLPLGVAVRLMVGSKVVRGASALAAVIMVGDVMTSAVAGEFLVHRMQWGPERLAGELAPLLLVSALVAHAIAAAVVDRVGHHRATALGALALGGLWLGFGSLESLWSDGFLRGFVVLQTLATVLMYVGVHAMLMGVAAPRIRATHFAVLMALLNFPRVVAPPFAADVLAALNFAGLFMACGGLQIGVGLLVRRFGRTMGEPKP